MIWGWIRTHTLCSVVTSRGCGGVDSQLRHSGWPALFQIALRSSRQVSLQQTSPGSVQGRTELPFTDAGRASHLLRVLSNQLLQTFRRRLVDANSSVS